MLDFNFIKLVSRAIIKHWDSTDPFLLAGYMCAVISDAEKICCRFVSKEILIRSFVLIDRLRKLYPNAKGEKGCSHRLFFVAYKIACDSKIDLDWAQLSNGVFNEEELDRMTDEFVRFLKFNLKISEREIVYWEDFFNRDWQRVPRGLAVPESTEHLVPVLIEE